jgi:type IV fimbrial biogenesis protein FimT
MHMRMPKGFTLVELMVAVSIAVILLTVAVPGFQSFVLNARRTALANDFVLALTYAKSEAVKRGVRVTVCSRATDTTCTTTDEENWDTGWLVFVDNNGDGDVDAGDLILQVYPALPNGTTLRTGANEYVTFQATGFSPNTFDTFRLCDPRGAAEGRSIVMSALGRVRTDSGTASCP